MSDDLRDFIRNRIRRDIAQGVVSDVITRFPPEPNGYLHIGHAKSICLNFGVAEEFNGKTYLRYDDTNPLKESVAYVDAIQNDVRWLGYDWGDRLTYASDYFDQLYQFAVELIQRGKAFVCDLSPEEIRRTRGTLTTAGSDSPFRDRSIETNLDLFRRMRVGEFAEGTRVLRAKIDMASPNINMRDPVLYRILHAEHHRTGGQWCIYPTYDFTHCICDALEGITHSLCTLEFEDHRPLYDWVLDNININFHPPQIEFARLGLEHNVMSKRILSQLVSAGHVRGWDDSRLPTLAGYRRRGVPPEAIREFCQRIGVTKQDNFVETQMLDFCSRRSLEATTKRGMAVIEPLLLEITNYEGDDEVLEGPWHPQQHEMGSRRLTFGREIYIERSDFAEEPPKKWRRLAPGGIIRLRYGYIVRCDEVVTNDSGEVERLRCTYFANSKSGQDNSGLKPKGVIQFVSVDNAVPCEFRLFDHLFTSRTPDNNNWEADLNEHSENVHHGFVEQAVVDTDNRTFQFERIGFFTVDSDSTESHRIFNRTVGLADRQSR